MKAAPNNKTENNSTNTHLRTYNNKHSLQVDSYVASFQGGPCLPSGTCACDQILGAQLSGKSSDLRLGKQDTVLGGLGGLSKEVMGISRVLIWVVRVIILTKSP